MNVLIFIAIVAALSGLIGYVIGRCVGEERQFNAWVEGYQCRDLLHRAREHAAAQEEAIANDCWVSGRVDGQEDWVWKDRKETWDRQYHVVGEEEA